MKAVDLVDAGEKAVVIYTHGANLVIDEHRDGQTGDWVISRNLEVDSVILYHATPQGVKVFKGTFAGIAGENEGRRKIGFCGMQFVGRTDLNWHEFAGAWANPIKYITGE
jgi:hypothetical protein